MKYIYRGVDYQTEDEVDEAIAERIGGNYNNIDPMATAEFEDEWLNEVEVIEYDDEYYKQKQKEYVNREPAIYVDIEKLSK